MKLLTILVLLYCAQAQPEDPVVEYTWEKAVDGPSNVMTGAVTFASDGKTYLLGNNEEGNLEVYTFDGSIWEIIELGTDNVPSVSGVNIVVEESTLHLLGKSDTAYEYWTLVMSEDSTEWISNGDPIEEEGDILLAVSGGDIYLVGESVARLTGELSWEPVEEVEGLDSITKLYSVDGSVFASGELDGEIGLYKFTFDETLTWTNVAGGETPDGLLVNVGETLHVVAEAVHVLNDGEWEEIAPVGEPNVGLRSELAAVYFSEEGGSEVLAVLDGEENVVYKFVEVEDDGEEPEPEEPEPEEPEPEEPEPEEPAPEEPGEPGAPGSAITSTVAIWTVIIAVLATMAF